jgi:hypothetical protein
MEVIVTNSHKIALFFLISVLYLSSCNDNSTNPTNTNNSIDTAFTNITWATNTIQFEAKDVLETDSTFTYFLFDVNNVNAKKLKEGSFIYVYGKALKKVYSVESDNRYILINTDPCLFTDAVKDADISWNRPINFDKAIKSYFYNGKKHDIPQGDEFEMSAPIGNDMKMKITIKTEKDRMDASCDIIKEIGKVGEVKYGFEGFVQNMVSTGKIKITDGKLKEFSQKNQNIEGEVTVQLVATGSLNQMLGPIELPFVLMKIPIVVGGIPMFLNLKILFVINTTTASIDASAYIKSKFTFNSETGIKYDGTTYAAEASAGPYKYDFIKDSNWVASSVVAGLNFGLTFPRFELEMFGEIIVPYVQTAFLIGGSFTTGTKPCMKIDCSYIGAIGVDLSFLGLKASYKKNLWQWDQNIRKSGQCD